MPFQAFGYRGFIRPTLLWKDWDNHIFPQLTRKYTFLYTTDLALKGLRPRCSKMTHILSCDFIRPTLLWKDWDSLWSPFCFNYTNVLALYDRPCFERIETGIYLTPFHFPMFLTLYDRPCFERIETSGVWRWNPLPENQIFIRPTLLWKDWDLERHFLRALECSLFIRPTLLWKDWDSTTGTNRLSGSGLYTTDLALKGLRRSPG